MSIQPLILGHVLRFTYHFPYLLGMMYYALLQSIAYSMMFVYKIWPSEYFFGDLCEFVVLVHSYLQGQHIHIASCSKVLMGTSLLCKKFIIGLRGLNLIFI